MDAVQWGLCWFHSHLAPSAIVSYTWELEALSTTNGEDSGDPTHWERIRNTS